VPLVHPATAAGVNKAYLYQYVAKFEWSYRIKRVNAAFL
jgi:hypothetical protein